MDLQLSGVKSFVNFCHLHVVTDLTGMKGGGVGKKDGGELEEGKKEGQRKEGQREEGEEEGGRERKREGGRGRGREGEEEGGRERKREGERERGRKGGREGGREGEREEKLMVVESMLNNSLRPHGTHQLISKLTNVQHLPFAVPSKPHNNDMAIMTWLYPVLASVGLCKI